MLNKLVCYGVRKLTTNEINYMPFVLSKDLFSVSLMIPCKRAAGPALGLCSTVETVAVFLFFV